MEIPFTGLEKPTFYSDSNESHLMGKILPSFSSWANLLRNSGDNEQKNILLGKNTKLLSNSSSNYLITNTNTYKI